MCLTNISWENFNTFRCCSLRIQFEHCKETGHYVVDKLYSHFVQLTQNLNFAYNLILSEVLGGILQSLQMNVGVVYHTSN